MGQTIYGQYSLAFAFVGMIAFLFTMGVDSILVRQVAQTPAHIEGSLNAAFGLRLIGFPLALVAAILVSRIIGYPIEQQRYILMAVFVVGLSAAK